ncbi:MAG TPA: dihydrofolate reductase family protein [Rhodanobacteraceae bacterium]|nr:dihydrofolate reductase family protein [Rhodanobacteraceae bacterium]
MIAGVDQVLRLFPAPVSGVPLRGLYLQDALRPQGAPGRPCVYASFIASLDGRIALPRPDAGTRGPPPEITNPRDWRLFQELAASADAVVTSGRYLRDLAAGTVQDTLPVSGRPEFADLHAWRAARGLVPQPAVVILTRRLEVPIPGSVLRSGRRVYLATGVAPDHARAARLDAAGVRVLTVGNATGVDGRALVEALADEGFRTIDMTAGGALLHTLLAAGGLDRLYLTQACRLLGGELFDTLLKGPQLVPPVSFKLHALHYDPARPGGIEQLFLMLQREVAASGR